ncbi:MAG: hypothetical protein O9322_02665 [Beijerinckiaceae bacterium]|nr:hypothetical protein [Beijerinckiaceae bacterium]MCZ8301465.1 hypothetical protein [Beijerinckiaceae bacterium]
MPARSPVTSMGCALAAFMTLALPALASPAACDAIQNGFNAVASVPAYRQLVETGQKGERMEGVIIGETVYMRVEEKWMRMRLKPGGRKGMLNQIMSMSSITDCREMRAEALPSGMRTKVYEFMMTPPQGMPGVPNKPAKNTVWIGVDDGLVYRQVSDEITVTLSYDKVVPPIP